MEEKHPLQQRSDCNQDEGQTPANSSLRKDDRLLHPGSGGKRMPKGGDGKGLVPNPSETPIPTLNNICSSNFGADREDSNSKGNKSKEATTADHMTEPPLPAASLPPPPPYASPPPHEGPAPSK